MSFSATGDLLRGSWERPETWTIFSITGNSVENSSNLLTKMTRSNFYGYIPIISTVIGSGRVLLGITHTVVHLGCVIFSKKRGHHLAEAKLGAKNIGRGVIELVPVIGNIALFIFGLIREVKFEGMLWEQVDTDRNAYLNKVTIFVYGKQRAQYSIEEYESLKQSW